MSESAKLMPWLAYCYVSDLRTCIIISLEDPYCFSLTLMTGLMFTRTQNENMITLGFMSEMYFKNF